MKKNGKRHIGVMELHDHPEIIYNEASLARYCNTNVTIFTTKKYYEAALPFFGNTKDDYTWVLQDVTETFFSYLKRVRKYCDNEIDLLLINTFYVFPYHQLIYHSFRPQCKIVHVAGRPERLFGRWRPFICLPAKAFILSVAYTISQFIRTKTLPVFDGIWVENIEAYNQLVSFGYQKHIACLPYHYYYGERSESHARSDKVKFVVIGAVQNVRRDYHGLLDAFEKLFDSGKKNAALHLLGAPYAYQGKLRDEGFQIIARCKRMKEKGMDIHFYTEFVPDSVLKQEVLLSDVIVNPGLPYYGTGTSGSVMAAMRFAKPGIYPANSLRHDDLSSSSVIYDTIEDLSGIMADLLDNREKLSALKQNAMDNSEKFSFERIAAKFKSSILDFHLSEAHGEGNPKKKAYPRRNTGSAFGTL